ncbi:MAG: deoxynucleoside kinase [Mycoplasmataceae bacterium]|nr:deoxynucleoside kinase [Mycoplasmataceae bacterium]
MKNIIVISGVSGVGKSTLANGYSAKHIVEKEIKFNENTLTNLFYKESIKKNQSATNMFLTSAMSEKYLITIKSDESVIFDRWIIDFIVGAELRIKESDPTHFKWFKNLFIEFMKEIKERDLKITYIILKINFTEFKKRILKRNRKNEVENILRNDTWYREYFEKYYDILIKYLDIHNISYYTIDTTNLNKSEVLSEAKHLLTIFFNAIMNLHPYIMQLGHEATGERQFVLQIMRIYFPWCTCWRDDEKIIYTWIFCYFDYFISFCFIVCFTNN